MFRNHNNWIYKHESQMKNKKIIEHQAWPKFEGCGILCRRVYNLNKE